MSKFKDIDLLVQKCERLKELKIRGMNMSELKKCDLGNIRQRFKNLRICRINVMIKSDEEYDKFFKWKEGLDKKVQEITELNTVELFY